MKFKVLRSHNWGPQAPLCPRTTLLFKNRWRTLPLGKLVCADSNLNDGDQAKDGGQRQGRRSREADKRARAAGRLPTGRRGMQPARSLCHRAQEREGAEPHVYVRPKPGGQKRTFAPYGADVASASPVSTHHARAAVGSRARSVLCIRGAPGTTTHSVRRRHRCSTG